MFFRSAATALCVIAATVPAQAQEQKKPDPKLPAGAATIVRKFYQSVEAAEATRRKAQVRIAAGYIKKLTSLRRYPETDKNEQELAAFDASIRAARLLAIESQLALGQPVSLIELIDPKQHAVDGQWTHDQAAVVTAAGGHGALMIPVTPRGDYELKIDLTWKTGASVRLILPVGEKRVGCDLNWVVDDKTGLESSEAEPSGTSASKDDIPAARGGLTLHGRPADQNPTGHRVSIKPGYRHAVGVRVQLLGKDQAAIEITVDRSKQLQWRGPLEALALLREDALRVQQPAPALVALSPDAGGVTLHSVKFVTRDAATLLEGAGEAPAPAHPHAQSAAAAFKKLIEDSEAQFKATVAKAFNSAEQILEYDLRSQQRGYVDKAVRQAVSDALNEVRAKAETLTGMDL